MDKDLMHRIFLEGEILENRKEMDKMLGDNKIAVSLDGDLYVVTFEKVKK
jgi:hypothetical protein